MKPLLLATILLAGCSYNGLGVYKIGDGTITEKEQAHVDSLGTATAGGGEWCYFSRKPPFKAKNRGFCHTMHPTYPFMSRDGRRIPPSDIKYVLGPRTEDRKDDGKDWKMKFYHTYPDMWKACGYGFGCTKYDTRAGKTTPIVHFVIGDRYTLLHEREYHVYRDVGH